MLNLVRAYVVVMLLGWFLWLFLDKPVVGQHAPVQSPAAPYSLPMPERHGVNAVPLPPPKGDWLADLQYGMDMLKQGETKRAFLVTWRRQYWLLSGVVALLLIALLPPLVSWYRLRRAADETTTSST